MIFAFVEDGTLEVLADTAQAESKWEGIDVENREVRFYDENGTYLQPHFTRPNHTEHFLGIIQIVTSGDYELISKLDAGGNDRFVCLSKTVALEPNRWFRELEDVKQYLINRAEQRMGCVG